MIKRESLEAVTNTHTQYNLIIEEIKHKDMKYLCDFEINKII